MNDQKVEQVEKVEQEKKLFYFLKLQRDFFQRSEVKILESFPNGREYSYFYLKLMVESLATNGYLRTVHNIPLNDEMLAAITNTSADVVRSAIMALQKLNMIEIVEDGVYFISEVAKITGTMIDSPEANKKRRQRASAAEEEARLKGLPSSGDGDNLSRLGDNMSRPCPEDVPNVSQNGTKSPENDTGTICPENNRSIEVQKNRSTEVKNTEKEEEETTKYSYCESRAHAPTREEVKEFISEQCPHVNPDGFFKYYQKTNWTQNGEPIRDWRRMAVTWEEQLTAECQTLPMEEERKLWKEYEKKFGKKVSPAYFGIRYKYVQLALATGVPLED